MRKPDPGNSESTCTPEASETVGALYDSAYMWTREFIGEFLKRPKAANPYCSRFLGDGGWRSQPVFDPAVDERSPIRVR